MEENLILVMDQPQKLATSVLALLADPKARERYGKAARRRSLMYDQRLTLKALTKVICA